MRLHKDNGSFAAFKKTEQTGLSKFLPTITMNVADYLIGLVWSVYKNSYVDYSPSEAGIMASIKFIGLSDMLRECEFSMLIKLSSEIALNELAYIDAELSNMGPNAKRNLSDELKKSINDCYERYKDVLKGMVYCNIPMK